MSFFDQPGKPRQSYREKREAKQIESPLGYSLGCILASFIVFVVVHWVAGGPTWAGLGFALATYYTTAGY